ncbi:MAG: cupin domain-containing protein [Chloroflexi bacterium]|nr:cupin domain-containing protein [Chloroflexota bacterium]
MAKAESKNVGKPDETRKFERGRMELLNIGGGIVGKATFEPGWHWSEHVKPIAKTALCEAPHFMYQISGRMRVKMADGQEFEMGPGDVAVVPSGHDAWVVGDEAVVVIDWQGATNYAKS